MRLRLAGLTYGRIAELVGLSRQRVHQLLRPPAEVRDRVVSRAGGRCELCGLAVGKSGHVHHTGNAQEDYNDYPNLQLLCVSCHVHAHRQAPKLAGYRRKHRDAQCAPTSARLIHLLVARQESCIDQDFAQRLGLSRPLWVQVRNGTRRLGIISLGRVLAHYPELAVEVLDYIRDRNTE